MGKSLAYIIGSLGLLLSACHKEYGPQAVKGGILRPDSNAVIIVNEGNFQWGNASIGQYNPERKSYEDGLYRDVNNQPLGDVIQEAHRIEDHYYLVMNGSNEIVVCDLNWNKLSSLAGMSAPKQLVYWKNSLWISDLYSPKIRQYDLNGNLLREFGLGFPNARMFIWEGELHFYNERNWKHLESLSGSPSTYYSVFFTIHEIVPTGDGIIISQKDGSVWFWPDSNSSGQQQVLASFRLPLAYRVADPIKQRYFSYDNDSLYVHRAQESYARRPVLAIACENFYGLAYHQASEDLYLFDARSFVQPHRVWRIDANTGEVLDNFEAGALPNGLLKKW